MGRPQALILPMYGKFCVQMMEDSGGSNSNQIMIWLTLWSIGTGTGTPATCDLKFSLIMNHHELYMTSHFRIKPALQLFKASTATYGQYAVCPILRHGDSRQHRSRAIIYAGIRVVC